MNIYLFHRDLRVVDNIGINSANVDLVPIFIFTPTQISPSKNKYFSNNAVQFMCECLDDIKKNVPELYLFYGETISILQKIHKKVGIQSLHFNLDYTPYARRRDEAIFDFCLSHKIECKTYEDYLLAPMGTFLKKDGKPYVVYGPFKDTVLSNTKHIPNPSNTKPSFIKCDALNSMTTNKTFYKTNPDNLVKGGREEALQKLKFSNYEHNQLSNSTTHLSAYIKYGCISIREAFYANTDITYRQQLIWREFYYYIGVYFPDVIDKSKNFQSKYDGLQWTKNDKLFTAWTKGETGYPIVDACMRELNTCGYMHNRGRLISSNFLNRILNMDWRLGELYFAQKLIDYDPLVNNGNWQWIASTGTDTKPYFQRLFNPWLQGQRFDPTCEYIKKWIPELKDVSPKEIHNWEKYCDNHLDKYNFKPIVNYEESRKKSIETYKKVL
jgi:deoxyribodipyrimidine photo-lyase